jgi:hypothetical protein
MHELLEPRILAATTRLEHLIELLHHLPHIGDVVWRHLRERLLHSLERLLGHLLLQHVQQFLELLARLRGHEVIIGQRPDRRGGILRQRVELLQSPLGHCLQQLLEIGIFRSLRLSGLAGFAPARLTGLTICTGLLALPRGCACSALIVAFGLAVLPSCLLAVFRRLPLSRVVETLRDPLAFGFDDLLDAVCDIA